MKPTGRPTPPRFPKGGLRPVKADALEDETVLRGIVIEGGRAPATRHALTLEGCILRDLDLRHVNWTLIRLADVRLERCDLSGAHLTDTALERVDVQGGRMLGTQLPGALLKHVTLQAVAAPFSIWTGTHTTSVHLTNCDLTDAIFTGATLRDAVLRGCTLRRTDLHRAELTGADLRGSDLRGIDLNLPALTGVIVDETQLLALSRFLGVQVLEPVTDTLP